MSEDREANSERGRTEESAPSQDAHENFVDPSKWPLDAYPDVLRFTAMPEEQYREETLERVERFENGEAVPHVVNFEAPSDLRSLLTERRIELLNSVLAEQPPSIRGLAERLDRDVKAVHDDLVTLADYGAIRFEEDGRAKRPIVPYETIEISLTLTRPDRPEDVASA